MSIKKILVTGANGQLGWEITQFAASYPMYEFIFADRSMFDLSKPELFESLIQQWAPQAIINTAAYTAVDKAEAEQALATLINATAVSLEIESFDGSLAARALYFSYKTSPCLLRFSRR